MKYTDTHTHLYAEQFDADREQVIAKCIEKGVTRLVLPNEDSKSIDSLNDMLDKYPGICYGAMGLHPSSVSDDYEIELSKIKESLYSGRRYVAIGEIGMDLYWDQTFKRQQEIVLREEFEWALELDLPVIIHSRSAEKMVVDILEEERYKAIKGVLHCWSGSIEDTEKIQKRGNFYFGVGGTSTYKNSTIPRILKVIGINNVVLETDSPFLSPVPFRGQRNDSSNIPLIVRMLSNILNLSEEIIEEITNNNSERLFGF